LLAVMGVEPSGPVDRTDVMRRLAFDEDSPTSIVSALAGARESARRARETVSSDMWEALNVTWQAIAQGRFRAMRQPHAFAWVRERAAVISGIADSTMSRDEGWHFLMLGRCLERIDMTARLICVASLSNEAFAAWPTTLRACGAHEAFLRTYRGMETDRAAAEFLLLDRLFPRSIVPVLTRAERCLENLQSAGQRVGFTDEALRMLGRARAELEYRPLADITGNLPAEMERLQRTCSAATEAIDQRYFADAVAVSWLGGAT
jgi:uncharacterized alpha-E superfamily protein